ncbi:hypothetical protein ACFLXB_05685 [Chloroflexota bacterium]
MIEQPSIEDRISRELKNAQFARQRGNEGMARVCARRAAGIVVSNYFREAENFDPLESPFEMLEKFSELSNLPPVITKLARNFTLRVSRSFELPEGVDLIKDAKKIV